MKKRRRSLGGAALSVCCLAALASCARQGYRPQPDGPADRGTRPESAAGDRGLDAVRDAPPTDTPRQDARPPDGQRDARHGDLAKPDLPRAEAGKPDFAKKPDLLKPDLLKPDLFKADLFKPDKPVPDASAVLTLACVAFTGVSGAGGATINGNLWLGFRFQLTAARTAKRVGLEVRQDFGSSGSAFAAIVALSDGNDVPNSLDLSSNDVLSTVLVPLPAWTTTGSPIATADTSPLVLAPGWYALIFGMGKFGATATSAVADSQSGGGPCSNGKFPFTLKQSPSQLINQGASPYLFIDLQ